MILILLLAIETIVCATTTTNVETVLSTNALNYLSTTIRGVLLTQLRKENIPDMSNNDDTPIGHVKVDIHQCEMKSANFASIGVDEQNSSELKIAIASLEIAFTCQFHYRKDHWPHISGHGSIDISFADASVESLVLFQEKDGVPSVTAQECNIQIGSFNLHEHGGPSWLYNFLIKLFKGNIENSIISSIDKSMCSEIDRQLNQTLQSLPIKQKLNVYENIDTEIEFTANPMFLQKQGMVLQLRNTFLVNSQPVGSSPCASFDVTSGDMLSVKVSKCLLDSFATALQKSNVLHTTIDNRNSTKFNTEYLGLFIPQLYKEYPNKNLTCLVYSVATPTLAIESKNAVKFHFETYMNMSIVGGVRNVFTLKNVIDLALNIKTNETVVVPSFDFIAFNSTIVSSQVGTDWISVVSPIIADTFRYVFLPIANDNLAKGFNPNALTTKFQLNGLQIDLIPAEGLLVQSNFKLKI